MCKSLVVSNMKKENIEFIAFGNNQIEFFESEGNEYINVYDPNPDAYPGICVNLKICEVLKVNEFGYKITVGNKQYLVKIKEKQGQFGAKIIGRLWGWFPFIWFRGKFSSVGYVLFKRKIEQYT